MTCDPSTYQGPHACSELGGTCLVPATLCRCEKEDPKPTPVRHTTQDSLITKHDAMLVNHFNDLCMHTPLHSVTVCAECAGQPETAVTVSRPNWINNSHALLHKQQQLLPIASTATAGSPTCTSHVSTSNYAKCMAVDRMWATVNCCNHWRATQSLGMETLTQHDELKH